MGNTKAQNIAVALNASQRKPLRNAGEFEVLDSIEKTEEKIGNRDPDVEKNNKEEDLGGFFERHRRKLNRHPEPSNGVKNGCSKTKDTYDAECFCCEESKGRIKNRRREKINRPAGNKNAGEFAEEVEDWKRSFLFRIHNIVMT